jgi:hypothetical protein
VLSSTHFVLIILMDASPALAVVSWITSPADSLHKSPLCTWVRGTRALSALPLFVVCLRFIQTNPRTPILISFIFLCRSLAHETFNSMSFSAPIQKPFIYFAYSHSLRRKRSKKNVLSRALVKQIIKWKFDFVRDGSQRNLALDSKENHFIAGIGC